MKPTGQSSPRSRLIEYLVAGYSFGVAVRRVRLRELVMVTAVMETACLLVDSSQKTPSQLHTSCLVSEIKHTPLFPHPAAYIPHAKTASSVAGILKPASAGVGKNVSNVGLGAVQKAQRITVIGAGSC
jgi:hypothetical protein